MPLSKSTPSSKTKSASRISGPCWNSSRASTLSRNPVTASRAGPLSYPRKSASIDSPAMLKLWRAREVRRSRKSSTPAGSLRRRHFGRARRHLGSVRASARQEAQLYQPGGIGNAGSVSRIAPCGSSASVVTMSEKDRALLAIPHASVIENGVDLERIQPEPETRRAAACCSSAPSAISRTWSHSAF